MFLSPFVIAASALHVLTAIAARVRPTTGLELSSNKDASEYAITIYFASKPLQELVEGTGRAITEHGGHVSEYFGLPSNCHDMGFRASGSKDAMDALEGVEGIQTATHSVESDIRVHSGNYCPKAATFCH